MSAGAEYAPQVEVHLPQHARSVLSDLARALPIMRDELERLVTVVTTRRLAVSSPNDQREIWRLAALKLGATEAQATMAVLRRGPSAHLWQRPGWSLDICPSQDLFWPVAPQVQSLCGENVADATAALCMVVWGPECSATT